MTAIVELREKPQLFQWNCLKVTIEHDKNITHLSQAGIQLFKKSIQVDEN